MSEVPFIRCLITAPDGRQEIACNSYEMLALTLPEGWTIEAVPEGFELPSEPPAVPSGVDLQRMLRDTELNDTAWTQLPGSPLTDACTAAFLAWRTSLHRHLADYPDGSTPLPPRPAYDYRPLAEQA